MAKYTNLLFCWILNIFVIPLISHRYHNTCIHLKRAGRNLLNNEENYVKKERLKTLTLFNVILDCLEICYVIFLFLFRTGYIIPKFVSVF